MRIMSKRVGVFSSFCRLAAITVRMAIDIALQTSNKLAYWHQHKYGMPPSFYTFIKIS